VLCTHARCAVSVVVSGEQHGCADSVRCMRRTSTCRYAVCGGPYVGLRGGCGGNQFTHVTMDGWGVAYRTPVCQVHVRCGVSTRMRAAWYTVGVCAGLSCLRLHMRYQGGSQYRVCMCGTQSVRSMCAMALACVASISLLASWMGPLARIHADEVVASWQACVAAGSPTSVPVGVVHARCVVHSRYAPCTRCTWGVPSQQRAFQCW
jgi:hypothetical protein